MNKFITKYQLLRGICIIAVVMMHCPNGWSSEISGGGWILLRQVINFHVAVFFFLSGYFASKENSIFWLKKRLRKLIIPFFFWSAIYSLINICIYHDDIKTTIIRFLIGKSSVQLYFVIVMIQFIMLTPLLSKLNKMLVYSFSLCSLLLCYVSFFMHVLGNTYIYICTNWMMFYTLGLDIRDNQNHFLYRCNGYIISLVGLFLSNIETYFLRACDLGINYPNGQIKLSCFLYAIGIIAIFLNMKETNNQSFLVELGDVSFGVFWCHMFFLLIVSKILSVILINKYLYYFLTALLTIFFSYIFVICIKKLDKKGKIQIIFGV